jgi:hypothetical protein
MMMMTAIIFILFSSLNFFFRIFNDFPHENFCRAFFSYALPMEEKNATKTLVARKLKGT